MSSRIRGRILLFVAPLSAVLVVLLGVVSGGERPFRSARVYSGPTQGQTELSLRVELGERSRFIEAPLADTMFSLAVVEGGARVGSARGKTDAIGSAEIIVHLPRPRDSALELWVEAAGQERTSLARGLVLGSSQAFRAAATRRGGFRDGGQGGEVELAVAPANGVLVIAQGALDDELVIRVRHAGTPLVRARVAVKLEGGEPAESQLSTDGSGLARLKVRPSEPTLRVALEATADGVGKGKLTARLEVVQGAIRVTQKGDTLELESGGAATRAYLGFFDENRRFGGAQAELSSAPDGRLLGSLSWPGTVPKPTPNQPLWVVASNQPDLASPSAVGWPLVTDDPAPQTFDARELLLLDGAPAARLREQRRARRIRWVTAGYASLALLVTLFLFVRRVREADTLIERHLSGAGMDDVAASLAPAGKGRALLAAACIGLGFVVLALFALLKE